MDPNDPKTADAVVKAIGNNFSTATATFQAGQLTPLSGTYALYLELKNGTEQSTAITKSK